MAKRKVNTTENYTLEREVKATTNINNGVKGRHQAVIRNDGSNKLSNARYNDKSESKIKSSVNSDAFKKSDFALLSNGGLNRYLQLENSLINKYKKTESILAESPSISDQDLDEISGAASDIIEFQDEESQEGDQKNDENNVEVDDLNEEIENSEGKERNDYDLLDDHISDVEENEDKSNEQHDIREAQSEGTDLSEEESEKEIQNDKPKKENFENYEHSLNKDQVDDMNVARVTGRAKDLLEIIKLNPVNYNLYDNPPLSYDVYMQLFGRRHMKQVQVQTKELIDEESQTDEIFFEQKSSQFPAELHSTDINHEQGFSATETNPFSLLSFLQKVEKTIVNLIDVESQSESENRRTKLQVPKEWQKICSKLYKLNITNKTKLTEIDRLFTDSQYLYVVKNFSAMKSSTEKSMITLWSHCNASKPSMSLIARSHVECITSNYFAVVAGMVDGTITLWDIREPKHYHKDLNEENIDSSNVRYASFCSAVTAINEHKYAIRSIDHISFDKEEKLSNQIATIDETGLLTVWAIVDTYKNDVSFLDSSEGMFPGSRLRLTKLWTDFVLKDKRLKNNCCVMTMKCERNDEVTFFIGLNIGIVLKYSRFEESTSRYKHPNFESFPVCAISCNPVDSSLFLVGYEDKTICLYSVDEKEPLFIWDSKSSSKLMDLQWLPNHATFFLVLEDNNSITIYDLNESSQKYKVKYQNQNSRYLNL
ncbi:WD repeat-containing protein 60-like isoform X2 [Dinothrombium tinctorium]|uniref:WD repeat-containing protein 60-like isoform X2 n=1 Tax=Dinothrombium tinctorium TaxID=1965070 RepID=A0A3S3S2D5_9ACAR|nr:WD repeat-containing protein 60-like isoform X2 [Dinothrombium tinctorium]